MDNLDKEILIEKLVNDINISMEEIERLLSFIQFYDDEHIERLRTAMKIINKKVSKLEKCKSIDEAKEYVKLKKVVRYYGKD